MDGTAIPSPATLPSRVAMLGAAPGTPWAACAEAARGFGLGLILRGLQRGQAVLIAAREPAMWLPFALGALGAGAVLQGANADPARCAVVLTDDAGRFAATPAWPQLLAVVAPARLAGLPRTQTLPELLALGSAVHGLDPGMWAECLADLRATAPALGTLSHGACAAALAGSLAAPEQLASGLAKLLSHASLPENQGRQAP